MSKRLRSRWQSQIRQAVLGLHTLETREVPATVFTWDGGGVTQLWSEAANWAGNIAPSTAVNDVTVTFNTNVATIQDIANLSLDRVTFASGGTVTLNTATKLDGSAPGNQVEVNGGTATFNGAAGLILDTGSTFFDPAAGTKIIVNNAISGSANLTLTGPGTLELRGAGSWAGQTNVNDGTLALNNAASANNTVPATNLNIGNAIGGGLTATLNLLDDGQIPTGADIAVRSDGAFSLNGKTEGIGDLNLSGGLVAFNGGELVLGGNINATVSSLLTMFSTDGTLNLGAAEHTITVADGQTLTINTAITGSGGIIKDGAGTLLYDTLTGLTKANTYTGATQVQDGTLALDHDGVNVAMGGNLIIGDGIGAASSAVVTLVQSTELPDSKSVTILADGKFNLANNDDIIGPLAIIGGDVITGAGTLTLNGDVTASASTITGSIHGNLSLGSAIRTFNIVDGVAGTELFINGVISGSGGITFTGTGSTLLTGSLGKPNSYTGTTSVNSGTLVLDHDEANGAIPGTLFVGDGNTGNGVATVTISNDAQIANDDTVLVFSDGTLDLNNNNEGLGNLAVAGGLVKTDTGTLSLSGDLTAAAATTSSTLTGKFDLGGTDQKIFVVDGSAAADLVINAVLSGTGGLIKDGPGTLNLSGNASNTFTGQTWIQDGTLNLLTSTGDGGLSKTVKVGDSSGTAATAVLNVLNIFELRDDSQLTIFNDGRVSVPSGITDDISSLNVNGGQLNIEGTFRIRTDGSVASDGTAGSKIDGDGTLALNATIPFTVSDGPGATDLLIDAKISEFNVGSGLIKEGTGTLELGGTSVNTYTGATAVNGGVLLLNNDASNGAVSMSLSISGGTVRLAQPTEIPDDATITIGFGGKLDLNNFGETIGKLVLSDNGVSVTMGTGQLTLNGDFESFGTGSSSSTITGKISLPADRTINVFDTPAAVDLVINGSIIGAGGLIKEGAGTLELQGNAGNVFTGQTWVKDGTLNLKTSTSDAGVSKNVIVGDGVGAADSAVLNIINTFEIPDTASLTINADGRFNTTNGADEDVFTLNFNGGQLNIPTGSVFRMRDNGFVNASTAGGTIDGAGEFGLRLGTITFTIADGPAAADLTITNTLTELDPGTKLVKNGVGTLVLSGANAYTGTTTINAGELLITGSNTGSPVSPVSGLLGGTGTIGTLNAGGGTVAPGVDGPGTLTAGNTVIDGILAVQLNGTAAGQFDQLRVNGTLHVSGATLSRTLGFASIVGNSMRIIDNDGVDPIIGAFTGLAQNAIFSLGGRTFQISYIGGDGNDVVLTDIIPSGNTPPTISDISNQNSVGGAVGPVNFTVGDAQTAAGSLVVTALSSNQTLLPNAKIQIGGSGANRTITVTPVVGQFGSATVTVTVDDGDNATATDQFTLTVSQPGTIKNNLVGFAEFAAGSDVGGSSATLFNANGTVRYTLAPFEANFLGGVRTAAGDVTGDGIADLIAASGPGRAGTVRVFDGVNKTQLFDFQPFGAAFTRGIVVAAGDITGDGKAEIVMTAEKGGGARVRIFTPTGGGFQQMTDFIGLIGGDNKPDENFRGGARAAVGDINGDGFGDLIFAAGAGGGPRIAIFDGQLLGPGGGPKLRGDFFAFEPNLRDGTYVAAGDFNGDGKAELAAGAGPGGGPRVSVFDGAALLNNQQVKLKDFFAGDINNRGGIRVAVKNLDNDAKADLVTGDGPGSGHVNAYLGSALIPAVTPAPAFDFDAFTGFSGGVYVG